MGLSREERTRHVHHGPACVAAFPSCCHLSEALTQEAREEQLLLGTSEGGHSRGPRVGGLREGHGVLGDSQTVIRATRGWRGSAPLRSQMGHGGDTKETPAPCPLLAVDEDKDFDDIFLDDLPVRTWFPDSWLWRKITLPESGSG